jgi:ATP-binding cassette subfamily B protein
MGFFSSLDIEGYDRQYTDKQLVRRAAEYFRPFTLQLVMVTLLLLVIALASAATPL